MLAQIHKQFSSFVVGIAIGAVAITFSNQLLSWQNAKGPVSELEVGQVSRLGTVVEFHLSGQQLRPCLFLSLQAYVVREEGAIVNPITLTWLTPSPDISRKSRGVVHDLGRWRVEPVPENRGLLLIEQNLCGDVVVSDRSNLVWP